jgi:ABC-type uncharacterized transport system substrate-binding protein
MILQFLKKMENTDGYSQMEISFLIDLSNVKSLNVGMTFHIKLYDIDYFVMVMVKPDYVNMMEQLYEDDFLQ